MMNSKSKNLESAVCFENIPQGVSECEVKPYPAADIISDSISLGQDRIKKQER